MTKKTHVVNKKSGDAYDVYIGRGSKWGNPFTHLDGKTTAEYKVASRDEAVDKYREWVLTQPELMASLHELRGKTLACFCKPARCHGDVLAELADADTKAASSSVIHIALTGHRPQKLAGFDLSHPGYRALQDGLEAYIEKNLATYDTVVGHSGLALGADTVWSKAILAMKAKYPGRVLFHAEIPMLEQAEAWFKETDIAFWREQVESCDDQTIYGSLAGLDKSDPRRKREASRLLNARNAGMVDHCDVLLALYDGTGGGTGNAVADAKKKSVPTIIVHPSVYF